MFVPINSAGNKSSWTLFAALVVVVIFLCIETNAAFAYDYAEGPLGTTQIHQAWVRIPIYFVTDRKLDENANGLKFTNVRNENTLSYGVEYLPVPASKSACQSLDDLRSIGWYKMLGNLEFGPSSLFIPDDLSKFKTTTLSKTELIQQVKQQVDSCAQHEIILLLHGCCVNHTDTVKRAGNLAIQFRRPILVYDWCALPPIGQYVRNEALYEQAKDNFFDFMDALDGTIHHNSVIMVGHSMGARFLDDYLQKMADLKRVAGDEQFNDVFWAQADVDAESFIHHQPKIAKTWQHCHISTSNKDTALQMSGIPRYPRLSNPGMLLLNNLAKLGRENIVDTSHFKFGPAGHDMPMWLMASMHAGEIGHDDEFFLKRRTGNLFDFIRK